jgi:PAS domain-containing protein
VKTPAPRSARQLAAAILDAHPVATLAVDGAFRIVLANPAARRLLGAREGAKLGDALACIEARAPGGCGAGTRCASCSLIFRAADKRRWVMLPKSRFNPHPMKSNAKARRAEST